MTKILAIAVAGAVGTVARYGLAGAVHRVMGPSFPWGTAVVNLVGCFAIGFIWTVTQERWTITPETRTVILVGLLGGFTTFSAFIAESGQLLSNREIALFLANLALQVLAGLVVFFIGQMLGRAI